MKKMMNSNIGETERTDCSLDPCFILFTPSILHFSHHKTSILQVHIYQQLHLQPMSNQSVIHCIRVLCDSKKYISKC
jgi:hypothetical protein